MRPTEYLGLSEPGKPWGSADRGLAEGLLEYEAALNDMGIPSWIANDPAIQATVNVERRTDYAQAAVDEFRSKPDYKREPGERLLVVAEDPDASTDEANEEPLERLLREKREALAAARTQDDSGDENG